MKPLLILAIATLALTSCIGVGGGHTVERTTTYAIPYDAQVQAIPVVGLPDLLRAGNVKCDNDKVLKIKDIETQKLYETCYQ